MSEFLKALAGNLGAMLNALTPRITIPFALAAWVLLYSHSRNWFPLPQAVLVLSFVAAVLFSCMAITGTAAMIWTASRHWRERLSQWLWQRRDRKRIAAELDYLTEKEREILAYLLAKQQKMFEVLSDGEQAATLIACAEQRVVQEG